MYNLNLNSPNPTSPLSRWPLSRGSCWKMIPLTLCLMFSVSLPPQDASADLLGFWLKPKVDYVSGTGDVFKRFEGMPAYGVEVGLELLGLSLWVDGEWMNSDQYWASGNIGIDFSFGSKIKFMVGAYGGVVFFGFPESEKADSNFDLTPMETTQLEGFGISVSELESQYTKSMEAESQIADTAFGLNGRLRLSLEYKLAPFISVGAQTSTGYHFIFTGEQLASEAKSNVIDDLADKKNLEAAQKDVLGDILGAEKVNKEDLKGMNYSVGLFFNLRF